MKNRRSRRELEEMGSYGEQHRKNRDCDQRFLGFCALGAEKTLHFGWLAQTGAWSRRAQPHRPHLSLAL